MVHYAYVEDSAYTNNNFDEIYKFILGRCISVSELSECRIGKTKQICATINVDLANEFPLTRLRKLDFKKVVDEFLFDTQHKTTHLSNLNSAQPFWQLFTDDDGWLGASCYNRYFTRFPGVSKDSLEPNEVISHSGQYINQLATVIETLREDKHSRRAFIINGHPGIKSKKNYVPPCAPLITFSPSGNGENLSIQVANRSLDLIFGLPYDIARYSLLLLYVCKHTGHLPDRVLFLAINSHIYDANLADAFELAIHREAKPPTTKVEILNSGHNPGDYILTGYNPNKAMKVTLVK
jgi:thymidylate synthase